MASTTCGQLSYTSAKIWWLQENIYKIWYFLSALSVIRIKKTMDAFSEEKKNKFLS